MFTEKDLVFPMPTGSEEDYLNRVLQYRSIFLQKVKGNPNINTMQEQYLSLVKTNASPEKIEGMAQIIKTMEGLSSTKQELCITKASTYLDGQVVKMGTLRINNCSHRVSDHPIPYGRDIREPISIGSSVREKELQFVAINILGKQLFVCRQNLLSQISWIQLNDQHLINGKQVTIDGQQYLLRTPTGGKFILVNGQPFFSSGQSTTNEWDLLIALLGTNNKLCHLEGYYSFCCAPIISNNCLIRGYSAATRKVISTTTANPAIGWRPVLELI